MDAQVSGGEMNASELNDGANVPEAPSPSEGKVSQRKEKKKSRFSSKKSRKKKKGNAGDTSPDVLPPASAGDSELEEERSLFGSREVREENTQRNRGRDTEQSGDNVVNEGSRDESGREHSMPRGRSTSRGRFSSLFRRKKRCKSETDISVKRKPEEDENNKGELSDRKGGEGISKARYVSAENIKRKAREEVPDTPSPQPLKSSLKPTPVYYAYDSKTSPRDRLHHMTLRDVAKEQKARRPRSLPRQARHRIDTSMERQSERPKSSMNLEQFTPSSPDSIWAARSSTLPRSHESSRSPTSQSSDIDRTDLSSPTLNPVSPVREVSSPVRHLEVEVHPEPPRQSRDQESAKARSLSPSYVPGQTNGKAEFGKASPTKTSTLDRNNSSGIAVKNSPEISGPIRSNDLTSGERRNEDLKSELSQSVPHDSRGNSSSIQNRAPDETNDSKDDKFDHGFDTSQPSIGGQRGVANSRNRRKASLTKFLELSQRVPPSHSSHRRDSGRDEDPLNENDDKGLENMDVQDSFPTVIQKMPGDTHASGKGPQGPSVIQQTPFLPAPSNEKALGSNQSPTPPTLPPGNVILGDTMEESAAISPSLTSTQKLANAPTLASPQKTAISPYPTSSQKVATIPHRASPQKSSMAPSHIPNPSTSTASNPSNPRLSLNDNVLPTRDMIDLSSASMTSSLNPDVEERSSISSGPPITSMSSSYKSSDQGYVDGDSDDDSDDDNSSFSTPPEDQDETKQNGEMISPVVLRRLLQETSTGEGKRGRFSTLDPDAWDTNSERNLNIDTPLEFPFSRDLLSVRHGKPKATRNVQRSKSDVDRRKYVSPRRFGKDRLLFDEGNAFHTPPTSTERLSGGQPFIPMSEYAGLSDEGDRASLTSTVTLTSLEGNIQQQQAHDNGGKPDQKAYPVMGTAAQQKQRRTFSPVRPRKLFTQVEASPQEAWRLGPKSISPRGLEESPPSSSSFPLIPSPEPAMTTATAYHLQRDPPPSQLFQPFDTNAGRLSVPIETPASLQDNDKQRMKLDTASPEGGFPKFSFMGLEVSPGSPVSPGSKSLVACLQDQSAFNWKKRQGPEDDAQPRGITLRRSFRTRKEMESSSEKDPSLRTDVIPSLKLMVDKECQTSSWLLNDLFPNQKSPTLKKKSNLFNNKKKKKHSDVNLPPLKIPKDKEMLLRSSNDDGAADGTVSPEMITASISSGTESSAFKVIVPSPKGSDKTSPSSTEYITPVTARSTISDDRKMFPLGEGWPKSATAENVEEVIKPSSSSSVTQSATKDNDTTPDSTLPKPKKLSFTAIILLKNRIAKFREKKNKEKEDVSTPITENIEPDPPSDSFMSIENEINFSKLEMSKETDIIDDDEIFEPEFSLDYPTKQLRFDPVTVGEPIQGEEPLPPLPHSSSRRLRQRRESTLRKRRKKCLSYCKRFVAFLFSHIGLCSLVVAYTIMGGFIFRALEAPAESTMKSGIQEKRAEVMHDIVELAAHYNSTEAGVSYFEDQVNKTILMWQKFIHSAIKDQGWDGTDKMGDEGSWTFASSLLYAITVTTTIGYGHVAPKTPEGRLVTIGYAVVGIPLTLLCLTNIGDVMATGFRLLYGKVCCGICCTLLKFKKRRLPPDLEKSMGRTLVTTEEEESDKPKEVIHVPTSLCILLIAGYIFAGAIMFATWEDWGMLEGSYFCFITLSTIGFGDIVPGMDSNAWSHEEKLVLCALYLVFGLSLIAMCFNLVQEDVKAKCRWLGEKLGIVDKPETPM